MGGGVIRPRSPRVRRSDTLQSGPAGGLARAGSSAATLGHDNVVTTDVGGTSFDVGLVLARRAALRPPPDDRAPSPRRARRRHHVTSVPAGAAIAWVDKRVGALRVGPASAGSRPGPACYGRGGHAGDPRPTPPWCSATSTASAAHSCSTAAAATARCSETSPSRRASTSSIAARRRVRRRLRADGRPRPSGHRAPRPRPGGVRPVRLWRRSGPVRRALHGRDRRRGRRRAPPRGRVLRRRGGNLRRPRASRAGELAPRLLADAGREVDAALDELEAQRLRRGGWRRPARRAADRRALLPPDPLDRDPGRPRSERGGQAAAAADFQKRYDDIVGAGTSASGAPIELVSVGCDRRAADAR